MMERLRDIVIADIEKEIEDKIMAEFAEKIGDVDIYANIEAEYKAEYERRLKMTMKDIAEEILSYAHPKEEVKKLDFNLTLGDTIKEKYESLIFEILYEVRKESLNNYCDDLNYYWLIASPEVTSIFETTREFIPATSKEFDCIDNGREFLVCGYINVLGRKFYVLKARSYEPDFFIAGFGEGCLQFEYKNFVI